MTNKSNALLFKATPGYTPKSTPGATPGATPSNRKKLVNIGA